MTQRLAIVLSGGGAKGAFQVGVLDALMTTHGVKPAIAVGTSTGAIQALGVAQGDIAALMAGWLGLKGNGDIYKERGALQVLEDAGFLARQRRFKRVEGEGPGPRWGADQQRLPPARSKTDDGAAAALAAAGTDAGGCGAATGRRG